MALIHLASGASAWRGYEYWEEKKVILFQEKDPSHITGIVSGSGEKRYTVAIDLEHPRKSQCTCPHAAGRHIVCKHMVALYFSAFPEAAQEFYETEIAPWEEEERLRQEQENALLTAVSRMKKAELQQALLDLLFDGPEWQYEKFLQEYLDLS